MWNWIRNNWGEAVYRAMRTALQVFVAAVGMTLIQVLAEYQATHVFNLELLWYDGIIVGISGILSYIMNLNAKACETDLEGYENHE